MALTAIGRAALVAREALKTRAYKDSVGVWTIGVGHTSAAGPPQVTAGLTITADEALKIFDRDLAKYEATVDRVVTVPLADHERDALVSICYNIGQNGFARATFVRKLNAGDRDACAKAIMSWTKPAEITGRRQAESDQFLTAYDVQMPKARSTDRGRVKVGGAAPIAKPAAPARPAATTDVMPAFQIQAAQKRLIALSYHGVGMADGKAGPKFETALRQLQQRAADLGQRVTVDGIYGPQTSALLDAANGDRYRNLISDARRGITAKDLAAVGTPAVVVGRRLQWGNVASIASTGFGVLMLAVQSYQAGPDLPWWMSAGLSFLPPWAALVAPAAVSLYSALAAKGLVGSAVERVREGIDNSGMPAEASHPPAWPFNLFVPKA